MVVKDNLVIRYSWPTGYRTDVCVLYKIVGLYMACALHCTVNYDCGLAGAQRDSSLFLPPWLSVPPSLRDADITAPPPRVPSLLGEVQGPDVHS